MTAAHIVLPPPIHDDSRIQTLGLRIKELRKAAGLTAEQLGFLAGLNGSHIWPLERGANRKIDHSALVAIARVLGLSSTDELFRASSAESEPSAA